MPELTPEVIEHALKVARGHGFAEVEISSGDQAFRAKLDPVPKTKAGAKLAESAAEPEPKPIKATLVGYYAARAKALKVGAKVAKGDVVATISALGISTDVESTVSGKIVEVLAHDGQPVEYGQVLALVEEA